MSQLEGSQSERVTTPFLRLLLYSGLQQTGRGSLTLTGQSAWLRFSPNVNLSQKHPDRHIQNDESLHIQAPSLPMAQPSRHIKSAITLGMIIILFVLDSLLANIPVSSVFEAILNIPLLTHSFSIFKSRAHLVSRTFPGSPLRWSLSNLHTTKVKYGYSSSFPLRIPDSYFSAFLSLRFLSLDVTLLAI